MIIGLAPIWLAGCATPAAKTGFLKDYSKLEPYPDIEGRHRYINPNINAADYSKFIVDPVAVNLSEKGQERGVDPEKLDELAKLFHQKIGENLKQGYQVVNSAGPVGLHRF